MSQRLSGKTVLVTGGARGMGAAHARGLIAEGAQVVIGDVLDDLGRALADELGDGCSFVTLDVTNEDSWQLAMDTTCNTFGGIDVLVNNAGVSDTDVNGIVDMSLQQYQRVINVNQVGVFLGMKTAALPIARRGAGSIINVSSIAGLLGASGLVNYAASKWAVRGMTKCAALEFATLGIRVNAIHPGLIRTPLMQSSEHVDVDALAEQIPVRRLGDESEVTSLVVFLASDESRYCTGADFVIDGGVTTGIPQDAFRTLVAEQLRTRTCIPASAATAT